MNIILAHIYTINAVLSLCVDRPESVEVCTISEECFAVPVEYHRMTRGQHAMADEEEELLQLAIQQSLIEQGGEGGREGGGEGGREGGGEGRRESGVREVSHLWIWIDHTLTTVFVVPLSLPPSLPPSLLPRGSL